MEELTQLVLLKLKIMWRKTRMGNKLGSYIQKLMKTILDIEQDEFNFIYSIAQNRISFS